MGRLHVIRILTVAATALATLVVGATDVSARVEPDGGPHVVVPGPGLAGSGFVFEIASNVERDEYFAVWPSGPGKDLMGQRVDANGAPLGSPVVIAEQGGTQDGLETRGPDITYNATTNQYLVVFTRGDWLASTPESQRRFTTVFGQLVSDQGVLVGTEVRLNPPMGSSLGCVAHDPDVTYDPSTGGYVLVHSRFNGCAEIGGGNSQTVVRTLDGSLGQVASAFFPLVSQGGFTRPTVAHNPVTNQIMVTQPYLQPLNPNLRRFPAQIYTSDLVPVGGLNVIDVGPDSNHTIQKSTPVADPVTGNWFVATEANGCCIWTNLLSPSGESLRDGTRIHQGGTRSVAAVGDGTFVISTQGGKVVHVRADGTEIHTAQPAAGFSGTNTAIALGADGSGVGIGNDLSNGSGSSIVSYGFDVFAPGVLPVAPARLLETRTNDGLTTVDGESLGEGPVAGGQFKVLQVAGRGGVPADARAVNVNVTAARTSESGFVTVYPCDAAERPNTSNLNYTSGGAASAAAFARLSAAGTVCLFTSSTADLIVDVNGFVPAGGSVEPLVPARLLDSRASGETIDSQSQRTGRVAAGSVTPLKVTGRGGVSSDADAVIVNVTAVRPGTNAFLTVYPCDEEQPTASNVNAAAGSVVNNLVVAKVSTAGTICVFSSAETDLLVDVAAYVPDGGGLLSVVPARLLETRSTGMTVDGVSQSRSPVAEGSTTKLTVKERGGVAADASGAVLNVTAIRPEDGGFITAYPCDEERPNASNVNFGASSVVSNAVVVKLSAVGTVCLYSTAQTDLAVDVVGYTVDK